MTRLLSIKPLDPRMFKMIQIKSHENTGKSLLMWACGGVGCVCVGVGGSWLRSQPGSVSPQSLPHAWPANRPGSSQQWELCTGWGMGPLFTCVYNHSVRLLVTFSDFVSQFIQCFVMRSSALDGPLSCSPLSILSVWGLDHIMEAAPVYNQWFHPFLMDSN